VDYNCNNKKLGRDAMNMARKHQANFDASAPEQYGSKKHRHAQEVSHNT
jgi:hypothetical protein